VSDRLEAARKALTSKVMGKPGVTGTAIGEKGGKPCLMVYLSDPEAKKGVPSRVDGFPVVVEVSGTFRRL
jgi:hypothetical protein